MPEFFSNEELGAFYLKLEKEIDLQTNKGFDYIFAVSVSEAKKLMNVLRAYDMDNSCVLMKYWR